MAAYMKTDMPFYGVKAPRRRAIGRQLAAQWPAAHAADVWDIANALWRLDHREEKYLAIGYLRRWSRLLGVDDLDQVGALIVEGAWWDFVDELAAHVVGPIIRRDPERAWATVGPWNSAESMWLRRTSIICQLGAKEETDKRRLFDMCRSRAHETEFFIRKAIGWALREYAKTDPAAVSTFVTEHESELSPLSRREALKHLV